MKILLLVPHLSDGGGERIASDLCCSLRADELVLVVFEKKFSYPYKGRVVSLELPVQRTSVLSRAFGLFRRAFRFRTVLRRERPDVVLSFMGEPNILNALLAARPIVTVHNHLSSLAEVTHSSSTGIRKVRTRFEAALNRILITLLFRRTTVVAVSNAVRQELVQHFRIPERHVTVISNAVNAREIQRRSIEPADFPWPDGAPVVITAGRLTPAKGQWHLIRAFAEVRKRASCHLAILGAGELEEYLRNLVRKLSLEEHVSFLGWQENPFRFLSRAKLFVLPSLSEAFGLAALEAMACGLPVISADCPGELRGILAPGSSKGTPITKAEYAKFGVLAPAFDAEMDADSLACSPQERELADAIVRLLEDPELYERYRKAGLSRVADFDHAAFVEKYQGLISGVAQ